MAERGGARTFEYDAHVSAIAHYLWQYTVNHTDFPDDRNKGIALIGPFGCGKSLIMEAYTRLMNYHILNDELRFPTCEFHTSRYLFNRVQEKGIEHFDRVPMVIDEIGRELKVAKSWGTESLPLVDLLFERYRRGSVTHITANFGWEELAQIEMYGPMLGDRFKEMFNFVYMEGESRRV